MSISFREATAINELADLLYDFLPGSGNNHTSFPLAAARVGIADFWEGGSKRPAIVQLLTSTLQSRRHKFCDLILAVVTQSMIWRKGRGNPLSFEEIEMLNKLLLKVEFRIKELHDPVFHESLERSDTTSATVSSNQKTNNERSQELCRKLIDLSILAPQQRGYAFERFLRDMFDAYALAPRASFRQVGEQIDGSFEISGETYLVEAKWQNALVGATELHAFSGKVGNKAAWTRGVFISNSGFSDDGLKAFGRGRTSIICMDGLDLHDLLSRSLPLDQVISLKARRAAETGAPFIRVRDLFPH